MSDIDARTYLKLKRIMSDFRYMKLTYIDDPELCKQIQLAISEIETLEQLFKRRIDDDAESKKIKKSI